jgi:hypothetical protein
MTPKTAPCFVNSGWYQDSTPMTLPAPASIHSATQTAFIAGPLGLRFRVQYHNSQRTSKSMAARHRDSPHNCQTHAFLPSSLIQFTFNQDYLFSDLECELTTNTCKLFLRLIVNYIYIL